MVDTSRTMSTPGVSTGTMIMDDPEYGCTSGLVTAITIRKSATDPLDVNHLCPLMTHSSPSRTAEVFNSVGSDPAVSGSVMEKAERSSHPAGAAATAPAAPRSPLASIPTASNSAFPESGALLPNTTGASGDCPRISCISPSRTCPNPMPPSAGGRCAAHSPLALTCSCSGRISTRTWSYVRSSVSNGNTSSRTKPRIHSSFSSNSGSVEKSQAMTTPPSAPPNFRRPTPCHYRGRRDHHEPCRLPFRRQCRRRSRGATASCPRSP